MKPYVIAVALAVLAAPTVEAQGGSLGRGMGGGRNFGGARTIEVKTMTGKVVEKSTGTCSLGGGPLASTGACVRVETNEHEVVKLYLGPLGFVQKAAVKLEPGIEATFEVFQMRMMPMDAFAVKSVTVGGEKVVLRDDTFRPVWRGWRRGGVSQ
jgi:hypothetical protein